MCTSKSKNSSSRRFHTLCFFKCIFLRVISIMQKINGFYSNLVWKPWEISIFHTENQKILHGSGPSSNLTEIFMRLNSAENFRLIGVSVRKLSCKRPVGRTYWPIWGCTHFLSTQKKRNNSKDSMQIFARPLTWSLMPFEVQQQQLLFGDKKLNNKSTLNKAKINSDDTLHLYLQK